MTLRTPHLMTAGLVLLAAAGCGLGSTGRERHDSREFPYSAAELVIRATGTPVRLEPGVAGTLEVDRRLKGKAADEGNSSWTLKGGTLTVGAVCSGIVIDCDAQYTVKVPPGVAVEVDGDDDVSAVRLTRALNATSRGGDVRTDAVSGPMRLVSRSGKVTARRIGSSDVTARSSDGLVALYFTTVPSRVEAVSGSGTVDVVVPRTGDTYRVTVSSKDGRATSRVPRASTAPRSLNARSGEGDVRVRQAGQD
ncbi:MULTISPECIES: DUF4097 family beta strand repeat-containing protein [Streptosporangium]|uniref:DUF4097 domain-containing protein n=1 Tax=Streptosporangium brasiliense TaxID=47480 RepID=A0ABT9RF52_9ACTN|nr:DUF4097 family beta strand repeat-containing protein [Streptosporangium brasiliense]MDP9867885.1 hypothetical protein [Streptosporangium brasiliense]